MVTKKVIEYYIRYFWGRVPNFVFLVIAFLDIDSSLIASQWLIAAQIWNPSQTTVRLNFLILLVPTFHIVDNLPIMNN